MKTKVFDPKTKITSFATESVFGVKCPFFYMKGLIHFSEFMIYHLKKISNKKKVGITLQKIGI